MSKSHGLLLDIKVLLFFLNLEYHLLQFGIQIIVQITLKYPENDRFCYESGIHSFKFVCLIYTYE